MVESAEAADEAAPEQSASATESEKGSEGAARNRACEGSRQVNRTFFNMSKIRINELARQLEVKSREVIDKLQELGIAEKVTHSSSIDDDMADKLRALLRRRRIGCPSARRASPAKACSRGSAVAEPPDTRESSDFGDGNCRPPLRRGAKHPSLRLQAAPRRSPPKTSLRPQPRSRKN